eukprot:TRINITY_DN4372_c0_g1_i4.p1 TRINITY_DN4372_c0_g1~~TRINITY_DN4372_c0_g1_i4.p1  ORF type:complete len:640 (+),score=92.90 TRINITY_DN4372_c0_g1_i4:143-1921(+)
MTQSHCKIDRGSSGLWGAPIPKTVQRSKLQPTTFNSVLGVRQSGAKRYQVKISAISSYTGGSQITEGYTEKLLQQRPDGNGKQLRKTKIVATIGPATDTKEQLFKMLDCGVNVARMNMSHGDHASHGAVAELIKEYNATRGQHIALMLDTKGAEVRTSDLARPIDMQTGEKYTLTIEQGGDGENGRISINYDGFINDVSIGDQLLIDGGIITFDVKAITGTDIEIEVVDGGTLKSRRHLNIRGKTVSLPSITENDWADINFGIDVGVDYYALSFVKDAEVIYELKKYLALKGAKIGVIAKMESADSVKNLDAILDAVDGAMVARGDLGAELPLEVVPYWQSKIIQGCRKRGKPVIVATNMLESMIKNPTPTRAEVSDIAIAVREGADAVMLSGESAYGNFPFKAVEAMSTVAMRTEKSLQLYEGLRRYGSEEAPPIDWIIPPDRRTSHTSDANLSEMFAFHAAAMANMIKTTLMVFSRKGNMPALLSHYRPDYPIFMLSENENILRRLSLYHGVYGKKLKFESNAEDTFDKAIEVFVKADLLQPGQRVTIVQSGRQPIWRAAQTHAIQVRTIPAPLETSADDDILTAWTKKK